VKRLMPERSFREVEVDSVVVAFCNPRDEPAAGRHPIIGKATAGEETEGKTSQPWKNPSAALAPTVGVRIAWSNQR